jgi:hypothetical protein
MESNAILETLVERLAPSGGDPTSERIWRFSERMAAIYQQQMKQFDEDEEAQQWRRLYSTEDMPPPDDTASMAEVAAQMAFYFPTHFFKFQKAALQQLLEWQSRQGQVNPYPLGAPSITLVDIGAGVGTASLAVIDLLAAWTDVVGELGYKQLGISVHPIVVEHDTNKQGPRRQMLGSLTRQLDRHMISVERATEVFAPYPEPECVEQILGAIPGGSLVICCISNFLSSVPRNGEQALEPIGAGAASHATSTIEHRAAAVGNRAEVIGERAVRCAEASRQMLSDPAVRNKLLLASEVDEQGRTLRSFARSLYPYLELLVRRNRVRFLSPPGCYWHSLQSDEKPVDPDCAVNFWSVAHWIAGTSSLLR